jgi:hypothetical protein
VQDTEFVSGLSVPEDRLGQRRRSPHQLGPRLSVGANEYGFEQVTGIAERVVTCVSSLQRARKTDIPSASA